MASKIQRHSFQRWWALGLALSLPLVAACGEEESSGPTIVAPTKKKAKKKKDAGSAPEAAVVEEPYVYSPVGKRDPFRSALENVKEDEVRTERILSETEIYDLDQYKLTGLVTGTSQPLAMVEDPNGVGHGLRIGDRIGKQGGIVRRITKRAVIVREQSRNALGEVNAVDIEIPLRPEEFGN